MEIVGRHHDPFTVMQQFDRPVTLGVYLQPLTDVSGALIARVTGAVAAYNWLVLLSFPLAAVAAYLLADHLALSRAGATVAAMAYAFSPFHLAHAAYHPHVAQTQWIPIYLLALWRCLDTASPAAVGVLGAATAAVTLSNSYGALIAAAITPVAVAAYWLAMRRTYARPIRNLGITAASLALIAAVGLSYASYAAHAVGADRAVLAFPRSDLFVHSARWWSYLVPPVEHPIVGATARRIWTDAGIREGLLEQQVSLGWGGVALAIVAGWQWIGRSSGGRQPASLARVPVLLVVAATALVCSLSPERTIGAFTFIRPSAVLYVIVPMFRSYARFGVVVQLMTALLAGIGLDCLRRAGTRRAQLAGIVLVALVAGEYAVAPSALSRDVLPTRAHRWVAQLGDRVRVLDCIPVSEESGSVQWLTGGRVLRPGGSTGDCSEPNLPQKLAATGYTHLLAPQDGAAERSRAEGATPDGLTVVAAFEDSQVFAVTAPPPVLYVSTMTGLFPRERNAEWTWRWMAADARWTIVNAGPQPLVAALGLDMSAFHTARSMEVWLDGDRVQTLIVEPSRGVHQIGPLLVSPGAHELLFHPIEPPAFAGEVTGNGDPRPLSFALGAWSWSVGGHNP